MNSGRKHLVLHRVWIKKNRPLLSLELRPQIHGLVVPDAGYVSAIVRCASGMSLPRKGKVLLGADEPGKSPVLRAHIGSLFPEEPELPPGGTVEQYVRRIISLRQAHSVKSSGEPTQVPLVASLLDQPSRSLTPVERRRLALGLALALESPSLLILDDPLRDLDPEATDLVVDTLRQRTETGAIIVCLTPTTRSARRVAENIQYVGRPKSTDERNIRFLIRSERPREVASQLAASSAILGTHFRADGELLVDVAEPNAGAEAITRALGTTQVEVFEVRRSFSAPLAEETP